jgi:hypothetical protein
MWGWGLNINLAMNAFKNGKLSLYDVADDLETINKFVQKIL